MTVRLAWIGRVSPSAAWAAVAAAVVAAGVVACARPGRRVEPQRPEGILVPVAAGACAPRATSVDAEAVDTEAVDTDADGLADACEFALARSFAPELVVDRRDCLWDAAPAVHRLGGGYLFAAERVGSGVRIAYLPAYVRDCGWTGSVCATRGPGCGAHAGDSELIVVDVAPADVRDGAPGDAAPNDPSPRWRTVGVFLSAHCFGRSDGRCRWYRGRALAAFAWAHGQPFGAPRVWVARGKHAHYPSRTACDRGHWFYDSCDRNDVVARFPVRAPAQNVGSRARPQPNADGCLTARELPLGLPLGGRGANVGVEECMWDAARPFRGWQAAATGAAPTAYAYYLARVAGF